MLAPRELPPEYRKWNRRWGAPFGRLLHKAARRLPRMRTTVDQTPWISSYFAFQGNNSTRRFEYPWAFHATPLRAGMTAIEIGGSLAGFQFVLDKCGLKVSNCDPGNASDSRWPLVPDTIARLNRTFGTSVQLYNCFLQDARLPAASFDRVFSISTIEHIPPHDLPPLMAEVERLLKPGGFFVATIDLFLDLVPFTAQTSNPWGTNIDVCWMLEQTRLKRVHGEPSQLYNFPAFDAARIRAELDRYLVGNYYPVLVQSIVLQKTEA